MSLCSSTYGVTKVELELYSVLQTKNVRPYILLIPLLRAFSTQSPLIPRFRETYLLKARIEVNTKPNDILCLMAHGDASFWPSTVTDIFL